MCGHHSWSSLRRWEPNWPNLTTNPGACPPPPPPPNNSTKTKLLPLGVTCHSMHTWTNFVCDPIHVDSYQSHQWSWHCRLAKTEVTVHTHTHTHAHTQRTRWHYVNSTSGAGLLGSTSPSLSSAGSAPALTEVKCPRGLPLLLSYLHSTRWVCPGIYRNGPHLGLPLPLFWSSVSLKVRPNSHRSSTLHWVLQSGSYGSISSNGATFPNFALLKGASPPGSAPSVSNSNAFPWVCPLPLLQECIPLGLPPPSLTGVLLPGSTPFFSYRSAFNWVSPLPLLQERTPLGSAPPSLTGVQPPLDLPPTSLTGMHPLGPPLPLFLECTPWVRPSLSERLSPPWVCPLPLW